MSSHMTDFLDELLPPVTLSDKQSMYIDRYMTHFNRAQAAKEAGYNSSGQVANFEHVQDEIERRRRKLTATSDVTSMRVMEEMAKVAFFDPRKMFDTDGKHKDIVDMDTDTVGALAGFEVESLGEDKNWRTVTKYKIANKLGALDSLAKILNMVPDQKVQVTGKDGGAIEVTSISDNDRARRIAFVLQNAIRNKPVDAVEVEGAVDNE